MKPIPDKLTADLDKVLFGNLSSDSLSKAGGVRTKLIGVLLFIGAISFGIAIVMPLVKITSFYIFSDKVSIYSGVLDLLNSQEYILAVVMFSISVVAPFAKIGMALNVWRRVPVNSEEFSRWVDRIDLVSKWAMAEVLVVAFLVVLVKASSFANAKTEPGFYLFLGSLLAISIGVQLLKSEAIKIAKASDASH